MATVNWMWFGNRPQVNASGDSPATEAEAAGLAGYEAVGTAQIKAMTVGGDTRAVTVDGQPAEAFAASFNRGQDGQDTEDSVMFYAAPQQVKPIITSITGFLSVRYELTFPDGSTARLDGVLIQMDNGDMFFGPSRETLPEWQNIDALRSVKVISAEPYPADRHVDAISFSPTIHDRPVPCFAAGTLIATPSGDRPVETIRVGDLVMTKDNGPQPVRWSGSRHVTAAEIARAPGLAPIRISAGALGHGLPARDLLVSQQHRVLVRSAIAVRMFNAQEMLVAARHLTELDGIDILTGTAGVTYVHLMLDGHEILLSNGAETESLYPGPQALLALGEAADEIFALFPQLRDAGGIFPGARPFLAGKKARQLASRHAANRKPLAS